MARARSRAINQNPCNGTHGSSVESRTHSEDKTGSQEILEIPPQPLLKGVIEHRRKEDSVSHVPASARGSAIQCRRPSRCSQSQPNSTAGGPSGHLCSSWGCRYGRRLIGGAERREEGEEISHALALALSCCCCCCCIPAKVAEKAQQLWQRCCELGAVALLALFVLFLVRDAAYNRFGTSNGRFISFVDTCLSVMSYREGLPAAEDVDSPPRRLLSRGSFNYCIRVTIGSFIMKFAAGFAVSLLLNQTPVFLKGPRHSLSLLLGLALLWLCPGDSAYVLMRRSHAVRLVLLTGGGLYKLRKAIYAVESIAASNGSFVTALLVVALAVDGNTVTRRVLLWAERQLHDATPRSGSTPPVVKDEVNFAARFCRDGCRGAWRVLTATLIPLSLVTGMLWWAILSTRAGELSEEFSLELRIGLLLFFIVRVGALQELSAIHLASMAPPPVPAKPPPVLEEPLSVDVTVSEPVLPRAPRALVNGRSPLRKKVA